MLLLTNVCGNDLQLVVILKVFMRYHPTIISCAITASLLFTGTGVCLSFGRSDQLETPPGQLCDDIYEVLLDAVRIRVCERTCPLGVMSAVGWTVPLSRL